MQAGSAGWRERRECWSIASEQSSPLEHRPSATFRQRRHVHRCAAHPGTPGMPVRVICTTSYSIRRARRALGAHLTPTHVEPISNNDDIHSVAVCSEQNTTLAVGTPLISIVKSSTGIIRRQRTAGQGRET